MTPAAPALAFARLLLLLSNVHCVYSMAVVLLFWQGKLTNLMALHALKIAGLENISACAVLPVATGTDARTLPSALIFDVRVLVI